MVTTAEVAAAAREWIADCEWADMDPDEIAGMSDAQALRGVERHYVGGYAAFIRDAF